MAYLVLTHPGGRTAKAFDAMVADLQAQGWSGVLDPYGLAVLVRGVAAPPVRPLGDWRGAVGAVVGEIFDRSALDADDAAVFDTDSLAEQASQDPAGLARVLAARAFGDYVCVVRDKRDGSPIVFGDPLGGRPAFAWARDGITLIGDTPPDGLAAPVGVTVDWTAIRALMADARGVGAAPPLRGVTWITPGVCRYGARLQHADTVWTPARAARDAKGRGDPQALRRAVDGAARAFLLGRRKALCEISGGLDSAIVATALKAIGRPADGALNFYRGQAEADERVYAQAAADRAATPLTCVERELLTLTQDTIMAGAGAFRPNVEILDADFDDLALDAIARTGADIVFTGHGGDVVFYQLAAAELAGDLLRGAPCEGSRIARLVEVALRTRRSIWSLTGQAFGGRPRADILAATSAPVILAPRQVAGAWHPWLEDYGRLAPAKRAQIRGLALTQGVFAHTRRGAAARYVHPLLSQPVVEHCLGVSTPILSQGEGERSFARAVFADRLPETIVSRRSKGDISVFFGRTLAKNAQVLADFLMDGRLVQEGVLKKEDLEAVLSPEALIFRNAYGEIVTATVLEAFVRYWEARAGAAGADTRGACATLVSDSAA